MKYKSFVFGSCCTIIGTLIGAISERNKNIKELKDMEHLQEELDKANKNLIKFKDYFRLLDQWLDIKRRNISIEQYFIKYGYHSIAIYGMGVMGKHLYYDLKDSQIIIEYAIDKRSDIVIPDLRVCSKDEELLPVDAIVVTATFAFQEIEMMLMNRVNYPIISLDEIISEQMKFL